MARLAIDDAAWTNGWRSRSVAEKAYLSLGLLLLALIGPQPVTGVAVALVALGAAVIGARVRPGLLARSMVGPAIFVGVGLIGVALSIGASPAPDALWAWGPFSIADSSWERAVQAGGRSAGSVCAMLLLATTTPMGEILDGLRRMRVPAVFVEIAGISYRMIFSLLEAQSSVRESQAARLGYVDRRTAVRSLGMLAAATFVRAWTHARRLEEGLQGRGYDGSLMTTPRRRPVSVGFLAGASAALVGVAVVMVLGWLGWPGL